MFIYLLRAWLHDVDLSVGDYDGRTPLHLAAAEGHFDTVKFLINTCKVNPDPKDRWNRTPYTESIELKKVQCTLKTLDINYKDAGHPGIHCGE
jgi:ankyrin repeat protein